MNTSNNANVQYNQMNPNNNPYPYVNQPMFNNQQPVMKIDNVELVNDVKKIFNMPNQEEKMELLGETIFYFLLNFIERFRLNVTGGKFDDTILCSKLTGILMHTDPKQLLDIISNTEILKLTIQDVIMVSFVLT